MPNLPDLSIVIPTCNRPALLRQCLLSLASARCSLEVIVVDGSSNDQTQAVLAEQRDLLPHPLRVIREERREGFVRAANKGFRAATGRNLMWLNDDARVLSASLENAVSQIDASSPDVGLLALFHHTVSPRNVAYETCRDGRPYKLLHVRGTLYANFGLGRREMFQRLDYFDERYFLNAADPDFSLKVWNAGLRVVPAVASLIDHDEHEDVRRTNDATRAREDNQKLFAKWPLPPRNPEINDFDPLCPCSLYGRRAQAA